MDIKLEFNERRGSKRSRSGGVMIVPSRSIKGNDVSDFLLCCVPNYEHVQFLLYITVHGYENCTNS